MINKHIRHFLKFDDFKLDDLIYILNRTKIIKDKFKKYETHMTLHDRTLAMIFEKASTRTRVSFEAGMYQMGGSVINLTSHDSQLSRSEPIEDTARVISRMVDIVMMRTFDQSRIEKFAKYSRVPVINGLTNEFHPCQILADIFTYIEKRESIKGKTVTWIGDTNNMLYTWLQAAELFDFYLNVSSPIGYNINLSQIDQKRFKNHLKIFNNPKEACKNVDLITTDVWTSMGYESEKDKRINDFKDWCVTSEMMSYANNDVLFMHCLPAHRGEEVTAEVIDGSKSVVWDEAENRLHVQKALMEFMLLGKL
ncbi:Ornithine carbamoyltransferase [Candidatus Kinetoplastibacterium sorsogonicusi]|uniref:Ornithine carbamoyltransferase n=1 Tax=Candidatus Kinetoplastidibacterium kentomonadis TaxID=1576550 RepID=A0A3S7J9V8_9PROT|nr:ornithine carbamoyltransferase [Candidatus Kinetoplastibacterium sorsogonicusi]AWD32458.1 Ornithine carbamoyltransferase [Candidatus Kinetoplastibacterium sorsogonicusi]